MSATPLPDLFKCPGTITFEGHDYKLRAPDQVEQGLFSRHLERREVEFWQRATYLEPEERDRRIKAVGQSAAAGSFEWGSPAYVEALSNPFTAAHMIFLVLRAENPDRKEVTEPFARRMVAQCLAEIVAVNAAAAEADPAKKKAILAAAGLPPTYLGSSGG